MLITSAKVNKLLEYFLLEWVPFIRNCPMWFILYSNDESIDVSQLGCLIFRWLFRTSWAGIFLGWWYVGRVFLYRQDLTWVLVWGKQDQNPELQEVVPSRGTWKSGKAAVSNRRSVTELQVWISMNLFQVTIAGSSNSIKIAECKCRTNCNNWFFFFKREHYQIHMWFIFHFIM